MSERYEGVRIAKELEGELTNLEDPEKKDKEMTSHVGWMVKRLQRVPDEIGSTMYSKLEVCLKRLVKHFSIVYPRPSSLVRLLPDLRGPKPQATAARVLAVRSQALPTPL